MAWQPKLSHRPNTCLKRPRTPNIRRGMLWMGSKQAMTKIYRRFQFNWHYHIFMPLPRHSVLVGALEVIISFCSLLLLGAGSDAMSKILSILAPDLPHSRRGYGSLHKNDVIDRSFSHLSVAQTVVLGKAIQGFASYFISACINSTPPTLVFWFCTVPLIGRSFTRLTRPV
jgi:hypothetical protein